MMKGNQVDSGLSEEGTSGAALSPPVPKHQRRSPASSKVAKRPYSLSQMILQTFENCNARKGLSLAALKKQLAETGYNVPRNNSRLKRELNALVFNGLLTRVSGTSGASGSFKFNRQEKKTGKSEPTNKKAAAAKKSPKRTPEPQKKTQKKQPPIKKPEKRQKSSTNFGGKNRVNNLPVRSNRKGPRRK